MKNKILTGICFGMLFVPWSILLLRQFPWALESPAAEIMIASYAVFMVVSGVFTAVSYVLGARDSLMKVCLVVNGLYAVAGIGFLGIMYQTGKLW